ncbi:30474_t:CDS:2, partial [Gigaspora margarita]
MVKAKKKNTLVQFLEIYFNSILKEAMLVKKAKNPVALFKVSKKQDRFANKHHKELNSSDYRKEVLELKLRQGLLQAGCVEEKIS